MNSGMGKILTDDCLGAPIDSTLPVDKIAEQFFAKNHGIKTHYGYLSTLTRAGVKYDHNLHPGFPLNTFRQHWDGMLPNKYFQQFNYKSSMPKIISRITNSGERDPVTLPLEKKHEWKRNMRHMAFYFKCLQTQNKTKLYGKVDKDIAYCMKQIAILAAAIENRPEPHMEASYNWLYAGNGNLRHIILNEIKYLLYSMLSKTYISEFNTNELKLNEEKVEYDCGLGNNILETIHCDQIVVLRLRYKIIILNIDITDKISFNKLREIDSIIEYTSINFDSVHKNILYITTLESNLKIVNIDLMKARSVQLSKPDNLVDNWNVVTCLDRSYYGHIQNKTIYIYDKRTNTSVHQWGDPNTVSTSFCNQFSSVKKCEEINFIYLATNHHLFLADMRFTSDYKPKYLQRWTHQCQYPPVYINTCAGEGIKEIIGLRSQWEEDLILLTNEPKCFDYGIECTSMSMPYQPPSLRSTLIQARRKLLCFDSLKPIEQRLCTSVTGLDIIEANHTFVVMSLNSLGDISCNILYPPSKGYIEDNGPEILLEWSKTYQPKPKTLEITGTSDISVLWKNLREISDGSFLNEDDEIIAMMQKYSHQEVIDTFENDVLDKGLLDAWTENQDDVDNSYKQKTQHSLMDIDLYPDSD